MDRFVIFTYLREETCTVPVRVLMRLTTNRLSGLNLDLLFREDSQVDNISMGQYSGDKLLPGADRSRHWLLLRDTSPTRRALCAVPIFFFDLVGPRQFVCLKSRCQRAPVTVTHFGTLKLVERRLRPPSRRPPRAASTSRDQAIRFLLIS